ncbi:unnamed protein product [Polarella glacialis]|uniref:Uncharacterized protein n=1 Tax=Polarella glacialis TaxID=89957 RepID=A0A813H6R1_POLGL|nr:unnamed protein product [Polarella glacialis]
MVSLADSKWDMIWCVGLHRCLHWYELVRLAKSRKIFKDKLFTSEGLMRVLCLKYDGYNPIPHFKRLVDMASIPDVEELIFRPKYFDHLSSQCLMKLVLDSRLCSLSKLHTFDVQRSGGTGHGRVDEPEIDSTDVLRILSQAPRLKVFIHCLTVYWGGRPFRFGPVRIDTMHKRAKLFDLVSDVLPSLQRFCADFDFLPALSLEEKLAIRTKLPHHDAISKGFSFMRSHPNMWHMEWGTHESRLISTRLVPDTFERQWSTLTGSDLFNYQFDPSGWNGLAIEQKAYFDSWATKCKTYETMPVDEDSLCCYPDLSRWFVKKIGLCDHIGLLQRRSDGFQHDDLYMRWLPVPGQPGFAELFNVNRVGTIAGKASIRNLQLRCLLVPTS